jgi:type IV secretory pathway VirB2 component (pilin)
LDVNIMKRLRTALLVAVLAVALAPTAAMAESKGREAGFGALSALSSLVYGPVKIVYATCGLLFGGIAWGLSGGDSDVATAVLTPSVRGDYVVTPSHLRMERRLEFFGSDPAYRTQTAMMDDEIAEEDW